MRPIARLNARHWCKTRASLLALLLFTQAHAERPNFLVILADDLGYSDIGAFGGEIETPNLDALAENGIQLTHFHTATNCSPTRAMLMTGTDNHLVGLGNMAERMEFGTPQYRDYPGYEGYLNPSLLTLPERLRDAGYRTYMAGKWHLGLEDDTSPRAFGFERSFSMLEGAAGHLNQMRAVPHSEHEKALYRADGELTNVPEDFYSSRVFARKLIEFLRADEGSDQPFFAYLAFTAPHWPLQAPDESIAKYGGVYDAGYEEAFAERLARQKALGLIDESVQGQPLAPSAKRWRDLSASERKQSAKAMEIYAAMVDDMDRYIGEVIHTLKDMNVLDSTVILFFSDNGADAGSPLRIPEFEALADACCDNSLENMGKADSYVTYGPNWARVSSAPSLYFKSNTTQGGILSPAILHYGRADARIERYGEFLSVLDVAPTLLDLAGISTESGERNGKTALPFKGASMASPFQGDHSPVHPEGYWMGWELGNHRAIRMDDWKLVMTQPPWGEGEWKLYNVREDPSESTDLSETQPQIFAMMLEKWEEYVAENGVALLEDDTQES